MTQKKFFKVLTLAAFVAMIVVLPLQAAGGCQEKAGCEKKMKAEGCEKMKAEGCEKMKAEGCLMLKAIPNLSDEQKGKLEKLHAEHMAMMAAAKAEMQKKIQALLTAEQKAKFGEMNCGQMQGQGCMKGGKPMEGKEGKGCEEKCGQEKGKCQKAEAEKK
jgi:hypothetical protein